jgi:hypothetical protein
MDKNRLREIEAKFPPNEKNLNEKCNLIFEYERAQKIVLKHKKHKTRILKHLRRINRDMVARQRRKIKIVAFGYWKYWFKEGKIGIEEDTEPNLVHS